MTRMAGSAMSSLFGDMGSPDFSAIGSKALGSAAQQGYAANIAGAKDRMAESDAERMLKEAKLNASVIGAQAGAQRQADFGSMLSQVGGAVGGMIPTGGGVGGSAGFSGMSSPGYSGKNYGMGYSNLFEGI